MTKSENLKIVHIKEKQVKKYKQEVFIPEGDYILSCVKLDQLDGIHPYCGHLDGNFFWFYPNFARAQTLLGTGYVIPKSEYLTVNLADISVEYLYPFQYNLYPHQERWLEIINEKLRAGRRFSACFVAPMGAGKTLLELLISTIDTSYLIVTNKSIKSTIINEAIKFKLPIEEDRIINYEMIDKIKEAPKILIMDEAMKVKNPNSEITKKFREIIKKCEIVIGLLAVPMSAQEGLDLRFLNTIYNSYIVPDDKFSFDRMYGINHRQETIRTRTKNIRVWKVDGYDTDMLSVDTNSFISITSEDEVNRTLPPISFFQIDVKQPKEYQAVSRGAYLQDRTNFNLSKILMQKRTVTCGFVYNEAGEATDTNRIKEDKVVQWLENNPNEPVVIFCAFTHEIERYKNRLEYLGLSPAVIKSDENYEKNLKKFLTGETKIIIISAQLTEGLNLQIASCALFTSNSTWPIKRQQAIRRLWRTGQTRPVQIFDFVCENTLDQRIIDLLNSHTEASEEYIETLLLKS